VHPEVVGWSAKLVAHGVLPASSGTVPGASFFSQRDAAGAHSRDGLRHLPDRQPVDAPTGQTGSKGCGFSLGKLLCSRMFSLSKPETIFTHESDLDGFVAGLLLKRLAAKLFEVDVPLEAYHNQNWRHRNLQETSAWVADMTFEARLDKPNWVVIDHHTTETPPKNALLLHDLNKSASLLSYELCKEHGLENPQLDRLVHLSNVADLFLEDDPDFAIANDYGNLVKTYQFWNLHELIEGELERLLEHPLLEVMAVKRRVENPLGYAWSKANITEISPSIGFVSTVVGNSNLIVHQLLEEKASRYPVLLTLFRKGNGAIIVSLRSRNGEAIKVAEKLQGGGHANACGASLPRSVQYIPNAVQYLKQVLNPKTAKDLALSHPEGLSSLEQAFAAVELEQRQS
jgi:hypothetical protein